MSAYLNREHRLKDSTHGLPLDKENKNTITFQGTDFIYTKIDSTL